MAGGYGIGEYGQLPFGQSSQAVVFYEPPKVVAVRENLIRITFQRAPRFTLIGDANDASSPLRYAIAPVSGTFDRYGEPGKPVRVVRVEQTETASVDLWLDRAMSSEPVEYDVSFSGLVESSNGSTIQDNTLRFTSLFRGITSLVPNEVFSNRDLSNPQTKRGVFDNQDIPISSGEDANQFLGIYPTNASGDLAKDGGIVGYEKRITRRLTTRRGSFAHLPNYGVSALAMVKQINRPGTRSFLADEAIAQIREEPETVDVSVRVVNNPQTPSLVYYQVKALTKFTKDIMSFNVVAG